VSGEFEECLDCISSSLPILSSFYGSDHPEIIFAKELMAKALFELGREQESGILLSEITPYLSLTTLFLF